MKPCLRILATCACICVATWVQVSSPQAQPVRTPQEKAALAAAIFAELCAAALPGMSNMEARVKEISRRRFGNSGVVDQPGVFVQGGSFATVVGLSVATPKWRNSEGMYFCQTAVARINRQRTADAMFAAFNKTKPASVRLTPITPAPAGKLAAWSVSGAKPGMMLQVRQESQQGVSMRLAWKG